MNMVGNTYARIKGVLEVHMSKPAVALRACLRTRQVNLASAAVEWEDCLAKISAAMARLVKVQTTLIAVHQKVKVVPIEKEEKSILVVLEASAVIAGQLGRWNRIMAQSDVLEALRSDACSAKAFAFFKVVYEDAAQNFERQAAEVGRRQ